MIDKNDRQYKKRPYENIIGDIDYDIEEVHDMLDLKFHNVLTSIVILSMRETGKTLLCKSILINLISSGKFHKVLCFSKTAKYNKSYDNIIPSNNIFDIDDTDKIYKKIKQYQEKNMDKDGKPKKYFIFVYDDIPLKRQSYESVILQYQLGRHIGITTIICSQFDKLFTSPLIKANSYEMFIGKLPRTSIEKLYYDIITPFDNFIDFYTFYKHNILDSYNFIRFSVKPEKKNEYITLVKCDLETVTNAKVS